jgi:predicted nucleic acid-binding protein
MRIYLDNCCYNRPFDDQTQARVFLETQAKLHIQEQIKNRKIELAVSFISRYENYENPDIISSISIANFFHRASAYIGTENYDEIFDKADNFVKIGIGTKDATHLACAIEAACDYFLTTDDKLIKKYNEKEIVVCNPITFLQLTGDLYA